MEYELDLAQLSKLNQIVTEYSKKYFLIKNNYYDQIIEIQDLLTDKVNICDQIDTQYTLIKELSHLVNFLFKELSFRKCIIERKDSVLRDLNKVIINKFIDKIYKQEIQIAELQKERNMLLKIKNNTLTFPKINMNIPTESNRLPQQPQHYHSKSKGLPVNVILPKNNQEYTGAYSFFNSSIKNIERFINIKNVNITGDNNNNKGKSLSKNKSVGVKSRQVIQRQGVNSNSNKTNSNVNNSSSSNRNFIVSSASACTMRQLRPMTGKSRNDNSNLNNTTFGGLSAMNKTHTNISNISMNASNYSMISTMTLNKTFTRNLLPSKQATSLLNKSYGLIRKYQKHHQKNKRANSAHSKSLY